MILLDLSPSSVDQTDDSIKLAKTGENGFFDDALTYLFLDNGELQEVRPRHIYFEIKTQVPENEDMESCDLRFYSVEKVPEAEDDGDFGSQTEQDDSQIVKAAPSGPSEDYRKIEFSDVAFFRLGYFEFMKLNTENMLRKYESDEWYTVDLLFDFDEQRASVFVNDKAIKSAPFFTQRKDKLESGNALSIYGLTPGSVSHFRNLRMC